MLPTVSNPTPRFFPPTHHVDRPANPTKEASISAPDRSAVMADTLHIVEQMKVENSKLAEQLVAVAKEREKLQEMMRVQTESFEKKMAEIERSNQETAKMLEARTLEVTKLQNRLQALPKSQRKPKAESGNAKKKPSKNSSKDHE
jgi:small-conductance mechanosensitive channel